MEFYSIVEKMITNFIWRLMILIIQM